MQTNYPLFRFDGLLLQLLLGEDQIIIFRTTNALIFFSGVVAFCIGSIYGTYILIGSSQATVSLFNSAVGFRIVTILFALGFPFFATWLLIVAARRKLSKIKTVEDALGFLEKRRGNVRINWSDVETATLENSKIVLNLKGDGFRAGRIKQTYFQREIARQSLSLDAQLELLREFLSKKLGNAFHTKG